MASSDDSYDYKSYRLVSYEENGGPPLIRKRSRLIAAVAQDEVDILEELLDSLKWYNVCDKDGYTLLQIAILRDSEDAFDYLVSIPNFPIDYVNRHEETALEVALVGWIDSGINKYVSQYFACELIKMGTCIDFVIQGNNTPLHVALMRSYDEVALLLINMGVDVNVPNDEGETPISLAVYMSEGVTEVVLALLEQGAVPFTMDFENSVLHNNSLIVQELLFLYSVDQYSAINFGTLLKLAENKSSLFHEILKCSYEVVLSGNCFNLSCKDLCTVETNYLKLICQRFGALVSIFLHKPSKWHWTDIRPFQIGNIDVLLENGFKFDVISSLGMIDTSLFHNLRGLGCDESGISEVYLYLLSYGLDLNQYHLELVYHEFGYCELFKLFLHMDIKLNIKYRHCGRVMPVFFYDITMNVQRFLENSNKFYYTAINQLLDYFVHPGLTEMYHQLTDEGLIPKRDKIPQIPSLLELARNSFRNHFIDAFKIKTSRKFYTLLKQLPISIVHEKIITYETKLY